MFELVIGSNNVTKKLEIEKIKTIIAKHYDGATFTLATGIWQGESEKSLKIEVISSKNKVLKLIAELKVELNQERIALKRVTKYKMI